MSFTEHNDLIQFGYGSVWSIKALTQYITTAKSSADTEGGEPG